MSLIPPWLGPSHMISTHFHFGPKTWSCCSIIWEAAGIRVWIRSHFQSHFPSHYTMASARTKGSTKPSVNSSNFTVHDMNGCICLRNLFTECRCSHVCFKVVTMIKRNAIFRHESACLFGYMTYLWCQDSTLGKSLQWKFFNVKATVWAIHVFKITLYANWAKHILHMNSYNLSKRCKKNSPL